MLEQVILNIRYEINEILHEIYENIMKNELKTTNTCEANRGEHLFETVFYKYVIAKM